jgi:anti-sigma B factor antagonist
MDDLSLEFTDEKVPGDGHLLRVSGEVDMATAPELVEALARYADGDIHVDLSGVSFLDSSGLAALVKAHKQADQRGKQLLIHGVHGPVALAIETSGLAEFLHLDGQAPTSGNDGDAMQRPSDSTV